MSHATDRANERVSWSEETAVRMFARAKEHGVKQSEVSGRLGRFLSTLSLKYRTVPIIYGQHVYIFHEGEPVTIFAIPSKFRKLALQAQTTEAVA
jgi:hypothetical protein